MPQTSRWGTVLVWLVVLASLVVALPNVLPRSLLDSLPDWVPARQIALGLDLSGGSRIVLKVERDDVARTRLQAATDAVAAQLRNANLAYTDLSGTGEEVIFSLQDAAQAPSLPQVLAPLTGVVDRGRGGKAVSELRFVGTTDSQSRLALTPEGIDARLADAVADSIGVLERRLVELGVVAPRLGRQGADRIVVQVPGLYDSEQLKTVLGQGGAFSFRIVDMSTTVEQAVTGSPPAGSEVLYSAEDPPVATLVRRQPAVTTADIADATATTDTQNGAPVVDLVFTEDGARRFAEATKAVAGTTMAVVLDGSVIATPLIREAVTDGRMRVVADMTPEGAQDLALVLRAGALPASISVAEERTIGAGRGSDSIESMLIAGAVGTVVIIAFMVGFYGRFGVVASIAVVLNVVMIVAVLTATGLPLTLPGLAGIVLTIGMAVDSNVLIFERFREEAAAGRDFRQAIQLGFARAFGAIVDANITTLIAAIILLYLGSGSIRGFAVTLAIGIVTTLFTAFTLTRVMLEAWQRRRPRKRLPRGIKTAMFDHLSFRFMAARRYVFSVTAALSILTVVLFGLFGINLGIDFSGGSVIEVQAREGNANIGDIRARLDQLNLGDISVEPYGSPRDAVIRVQSRDGGENAEQTAVILIRDELDSAYELRRVEVVGPTVSETLTRSATIGVAISLLGILLYIWARYEWQFAAGAIVATLHDVILTMGLFVVTGMEFNLTSVAALLTIVGYSLNDTVIVYDRIRENLNRFPRMPLPILIDTAINQTLSRTVLTGATTLLALAALSLFGSDTIRPFAVVLMFGVAVATFSSIYVAGPVLILFRLKRARARARDMQGAA
ncbi:protein translocase subunit secF /protein translocase subunit secD [Rhizobium sp. PP-F2F-G20b]|nr:protein translocase subunit secF /protein translocase subunit secD [Rhizobium sp. PP-F2F-G20b]